MAPPPAATAAPSAPVAGRRRKESKKARKVYDQKKIICACPRLEGEYGVNGLFVGVPTLFGANGVEKVIECDLTDAEKEAFQKSVGVVQKTVDEVEAMSK